MQPTWLAKKWEQIFFNKFRLYGSLRLKTWRGSWWWIINYNLKKVSKIIDTIHKWNPEAIDAYFEYMFRQGYDWLYLYYLGIKIRKSNNLYACYESAKHEWHKYTTRLWQENYYNNNELDYTIPID